MNQKTKYVLLLNIIEKSGATQEIDKVLNLNTPVQMINLRNKKRLLPEVIKSNFLI